MKKFKKILVGMLIFIMVLISGFQVGATEHSMRILEQVATPELLKVMDESEENEKIPVDIWLQEPISTEEIAFGIELIKNNDNMLDEESSAETIDKYIMEERTLYVEQNKKQYQDFLKKYQKIEALDNDSSSSKAFFSKYAPLINVGLTKAEISLLAQDDRVVAIYYSPEPKISSETSHSIPTIRAIYTRDTLGCTGTGVKIGMLESSGLPKRTLGYFNSSNIIYDPNVVETYSDHANLVASIMVAKAVTVNGTTYEGIVPDATLYATYCSNYNWRERIEWLLSQGVNVINMSVGLGETGTYGTNELWIDHIAINHSVHFVKSAGNTSGEITSPGLAYNILTVGSIDDNNTTTYTDDVKSDRSSYIEIEGPNKPDLMAPGVNIRSVAGLNSGTSFAAPHVTGVIAQLCQRRPALKTLQGGMKAILTASIKHSVHSYDTADFNYDEYGAGVVDATSAFYTSDNYRFATGNFAANSSVGTQKTYTFNVTSSDLKNRISLSWLKYSVLSGTHASSALNEHEVANLDLYLYDPDGILVASSRLASGNNELIEFIHNKTGMYKIVIRQAKSSERAVYFGIAWW